MNGRFGFTFLLFRGSGYAVLQQIVTAILSCIRNFKGISIIGLGQHDSCSGLKLQIVVAVAMKASQIRLRQLSYVCLIEQECRRAMPQLRPYRREPRRTNYGKESLSRQKACASSRVLTVERKCRGRKVVQIFSVARPKFPVRVTGRPPIPHKSKSRIKWQDSCYSSGMEAPLMPEPIASPLCFICNNPVELEISKTDENGHAVHERCYLLRLRQRQATTEPNTSRQCEGLKSYREFSGISFRARRSTMIG